MAKDLRSYLDELLEKRPKDVVVVDQEVDPVYGARGIVEKVERKNEFPLVFFKNIKGSKIPLVINLGATYERLALSLGSPSVPQMVKDLAHREHNPVPVKEIAAKDAPCKEVILKGDAADLDLLPVLTINEGDAGAYVNAAAMICKERGTGAVNVGIYRHQKQGKRQLGLMVNSFARASTCGTRLFALLDLDLDIAEKGIDAAVKAFDQVRAGDPNRYHVDENKINQLGYRLLNSGKTGDAVEVFKLNVREFPKSANVYDSLGEAYAKSGNREQAIQNYKRAAELDPKNTNALEAIKRLTGAEEKMDTRLLEDYVGKYDSPILV
jgi:tetratricopeptide (TPR) repeat protein